MKYDNKRKHSLEAKENGIDYRGVNKKKKIKRADAGKLWRNKNTNVCF